ncbi:MAG: transcription termination/antitermination protein NusG [Gammaproteobacteria bacterium]
MDQQLSAKRWYVLQVASGDELKVKKSLEEKIKTGGYENQFGDILIPTEEIVEMRSGHKRKTERKFFPGYVLLQIDMSDNLWHIVRNIPKVLGFVGGTPDRPACISDKEAHKILSRIEEAIDKPKPKVLFEPGEVIRVIDGPFAEFNGVVEEVNYDKNRLRVSVMIFSRSTPVDLDFSQVEKN